MDFGSVPKSIGVLTLTNRLYGPNMELIHPRIAKLWAKEKCDARTDVCGGRK